MDSVISPTALFSSASLCRPNPKKGQSATFEQLCDVHVQIVLLKFITNSFVFPSFLCLFSGWFFFVLFCFCFFAKHNIVGRLFRNIHPSLQYSSHSRIHTSLYDFFLTCTSCTMPLPLGYSVHNFHSNY